jgi:hypothetical protein
MIRGEHSQKESEITVFTFEISNPLFKGAQGFVNQMFV